MLLRGRSAYSLLKSPHNMAFNYPPEVLLRKARQPVMKFCTTQRSIATVRAAVCTEFGKPLTIEELPRQNVGPGEVRVAIHNVGLNFADILSVQGKYQEMKNPPFVPGTELAGEVLEIAGDVANVKLGDRVFGLSSQAGGYAEEVVVPSIMINPLPSNVAYPTAAAFLTAYGTAELALTRRANLKSGDTVLVTAAAGAFGLAAVDLATNVHGAKVIGAAGGPDKCALVKQRGAIECIDYTKESIRDRVKEITNGNGADIILDPVGGKTFMECLRCIAFEGRIVVIGFTSGEIPKIPANILLLKSCSAVGVYWGSYSMRKPLVFMESVHTVTKYLSEGNIRPYISKIFPLNQVNEAMKFLFDRRSTGKVVLSTKS